MNKVIITGNLGKDPEIRYTTGEKQTAITRFTVAVNDWENGETKTTWVPVVTFGKKAENCAKFLSKGRKVLVEGKLNIRSYEKQDGTKASFTEVVAWDVEFLSNQEQVERNQAEAQKGQWNQPQQTQPPAQPAWSNPQCTAPPQTQTQAQPPAQQNITYQQYQEQKAQEQMQIPEGFAALQEEVPF